MKETLDPYIAEKIRAVGQDPETWWEGHSDNCSFGGFSCLYWLADEHCTAEHPNIHVHAKGDRCPFNA
jgi:hypothetical protein